MLAAVRRTETMHEGVGSSRWSVTVRDDGAVEAERETDGVRTVLRCAPLDAAALAELAGLVQAAPDAGLEPRYVESDLSGPQANYSRDRRIVLGGGRPFEVQVVDWADVPPELEAVEQRLDAAAARCTPVESRSRARAEFAAATCLFPTPPRESGRSGPKTARN